ncbi:MAG: hypothetical protein ABI539_06650 [Acidobacteriota bacterium]
MIIKIYLAMWMAVLATGAIFAIAGMFTQMFAVIFGFTLFSLVFMGMISVLPATFGNEHAEVETAQPALAPVAQDEGTKAQFAHGQGLIPRRTF